MKMITLPNCLVLKETEKAFLISLTDKANNRYMLDTWVARSICYRTKPKNPPSDLLQRNAAESGWFFYDITLPKGIAELHLKSYT